MGVTLQLVNRSAQANTMTGEPDYSIYTLRQLLMARHWFDLDGYSGRGSRLEEEIHKRCAHSQDSSKRQGSVTARSRSRYRLYGLMAGVFCLVVSTGPFIAIEFLDAMNIITDVNSDTSLLPGVWALLTLPFSATVFMLGAIIDAERVVKWFKL